MWLVPLSALTLLPSPEYHQLSVGPYAATVRPGPVPIPDFGTAPIRGMELSYHRLTADTSDKDGILGGQFSGNTETITARIGVDQDGYIQLDQLRADSLLASLRIRRNLGDTLDLSLIGGHWMSTWGLAEGDQYRLRALVPSNLTLVGLSNTDQDNDEKLKYYFSIGSGFGGEFIGRALGPIGVYGRAIVKLTSQNRHRPDQKNSVRNEVWFEPMLGLAYIGTEGSVILSGWGEVTTQWETRDDDGRSGIDRQYIAGGLRLTGRLGVGDPAVTPSDDAVRVSL
ncbi:MAG: hypothetical protein ACI8RZ_007554 [Myxococcota bacterium]|jgi:hypothetical protein